MKAGPATIALIAALPILGLVGYASAFTVHETQQALVLQFGAPKRTVKEPGLHFKLPFIQQVRYLDGRLLHFDAVAAEIIAADKKRLIVDAYARYRIDRPLQFYKSVRGEMAIAEARLAPIVSSSLREVLASVGLQAILSAKRAELRQQITQQVSRDAAEIGIDVVDVRITRTDLPEANSEAIYARMRAEREREAKEIRARGAEEAQRIRADADRQVAVLLAEAERAADMLRGEGDGERLQIYAEAARQDPEFFAFYQSMKVYRSAMNDTGTTMMLSPDNNQFLRYFDNSSGGEPASPASTEPGSPPGAPSETPVSDASETVIR